MSRRKQSCPRPVKGQKSQQESYDVRGPQLPPELGQSSDVSHEDVFSISLGSDNNDSNNGNSSHNSSSIDSHNAFIGNIASPTTSAIHNAGTSGSGGKDDDDDVDANDNNDSDDDYIKDDDNLVIALSPRPDDDDNDGDDAADGGRSRDNRHHTATALNFSLNNNNNNNSDDRKHKAHHKRNVNTDVLERNSRHDSSDFYPGNTISRSRSSSGTGKSRSNQTYIKSNAHIGGSLRREDGLMPQNLSSTFSHHHLLPPAFSSSHPPPNFLLQPPPPQIPAVPAQRPENLSRSAIFPHGPPPQPTLKELQFQLTHSAQQSPVSALFPSTSLQPHPRRSDKFLNEMARRKRSPNSIRWNHRGLAQTAHPEADLIQCQVCMNQIRSCGDIKAPVEQVDYFVDDDGTLTIKNDICPRTVALSLLCGGPQSQKTFRQRLGEDYNMFILNLEQILKKHPQTCPGELATQVASADDLIQEHHLRQKLLSHSRKRSHDLMSHGVTDNSIIAKQPETILTIQKHRSLQDEKEDAQADVPDNFLSIPLSRELTPPPHVGKNDDSLTLTSSDSTVPKSIFDCDKNNNDSNAHVFLDGDDDDVDDDDDNVKDKSMLGDESEGKGMSSRSVSPASLISQGMTVAEAAIANKQMANTKRGSKILPVSASTDGLVKYQCPICSLELSGDHELTVHIRSHNQSHLQVMPNTCTICGKTLSSQSSLDRHMLVHSGERPFKCSICDMSFTTNGNMHRHSRIHQKNGINIKPIGRKSNDSKSKSSSSSSNNNSSNSNSHHLHQPQQRHLPSPSSSSTSSTSAGSAMQPQFPSTFRDDLSTPKRKGGHHSNAQSSTQPDQSVEFLHYMNGIKNLQQFKLLSMSNYMFPFNAAPSTHSAFPISPYVHEQLRLQYLQAFMNPLNGEPLAKRPCFPSFVMPPPRAPSPDLRVPTVHPCKECGAEFTNQFALESHMESHVIVDEKMEVEAGTACKTCKTVAKSAESLLLHTLTHHKKQEELTTPDPKPSTPPPSKESSASEMETEQDSGVVVQTPIAQNEVLEIEKTPSSFMNLGFADCTTKKFPLIAKAFCEDNPDLKAKKFPVFKCQHCDKEFPVEGAKELHEASHVPEEYTKCPKCNCHFSDSSRLQEHMLKHVSDLKFEESLEKGQTSNEVESSENMSQNYFLAQFGLITSEDHDEAVDDEKVENIKTETDGNFDNESMMDASFNNDDPSESVMSEDCPLTTTDNEEDSRSCMSDTKILTIPFSSSNNSKDNNDNNNNNNNNVGICKEELRTSHSGKDDSTLSLPSAEILSDLAAMRPGKSPASSIGSDVTFPIRMPDSPLLPLPTKHRDEVLPPLFPCKYCDAILASATDLKNHQLLHKDSAPFQCKVCPYISTDKSTLLRHMRTHSGERPYKCKLCDYSFTTKANCERHLRQKHNLHKHDLKDQLIHRQFDVQQLLQKGNNSAGALSQGRAICKACGDDFLNFNGLQQHILLNQGCRTIYGCKSCKTTFPTKTSVIEHMSQKHGDVPADTIGQYITKMENTPSLGTITTALHTPSSSSSSSPPPAHSKPTTPKKLVPESSSGSSSTTVTTPDKMSSTGTKLLKSYLTARNNARTNTIVTNPTLLQKSPPSPQQQLLPVKPESDLPLPLNFAQRSTTTAITTSDNSSTTTLEKEAAQRNQDELPVFDDQPLDLSVSRSSSPSSTSGSDPVKGQGHESSGRSSSSSSPTKQTTAFGLTVPTIKQEPLSFLQSSMDRRNTHLNPNPRKTKTPSLSPRNLLPDGNYSHHHHRQHHISSTNTSGKGINSKNKPSSSAAVAAATNIEMSLKNISEQRHGGSPGLGYGIQGVLPAPLVLPASLLPKHPAFPQFHPMMSSLGFSPECRQQQVISPSPSSPHHQHSTSKSPVNSSKSKRKSTPDRASQSLREAPTSDIKISMQAMQPSVILTDLKDKKSKGSSSGSDSSCELAPVAKMLNAADAQNFQEYLAIPETEDEQDSMSVSEMSGEDSNMSMENMFSNSYLDFQRARIARMTGEATVASEENPKEDDNPITTTSNTTVTTNNNKTSTKDKVKDEATDDGPNGKETTTLTVGMALLGEGSAHPDLKNKPLLLDDCPDEKHPDPSNMSEQEIARLIEKVSRENDGCPAKKKRNSYADSPHKFACPYCPRCFPWMSSLNRHLLTHTGQKPFRCSRCPVTFSTKSNRERHLIRKHNVNMLDPSSRSTMDRPYKCHFCVFSSFSTKSNMIKHYKERHNGTEPPPKALEAVDGLEEFEGDDINGKTCEEEEEEYALAQKMQENENCVMLHGYYNDGNENSITSQRDPHKKRNVLFNLSLGEGITKQDMAISPTPQNDDNNDNNNNNNANFKDNNAQSLSSLTNRSCTTANNNNNINNSISNSARSSPSSGKNSSSATALPGIDETVLTDTVREFLDKSLQQSLEDSQRKALEEGSTFCITPAMERHLRRFPNKNNNNSNSNSNAESSSNNQQATSSSTGSAYQLLPCVHCNLEFPSKKKLKKHLKMHKEALPYSCHLCDDTSFASRVECLQHQAVSHKEEWRRLEEHNGIRNLEVFATRLDKMVIKSHKRGKSVSASDGGDKQEPVEDINKKKSFGNVDGETAKDAAAFEDVNKTDKQNSNNKMDAVEDVTTTTTSISGSSTNTKTTGGSHQTKKFLCALCPDALSSRKELKDHMQSHSGNQSKTLSPKNAHKTQATISSSTTSSPSPSPSTTTAIPRDVMNAGEETESQDGGDTIDMLHNLLGVESSTIDEIFEAKVSAASILGVGGANAEAGKPAKP